MPTVDVHAVLTFDIDVIVFKRISNGNGNHWLNDMPIGERSQSWSSLFIFCSNIVFLLNGV